MPSMQHPAPTTTTDHVQKARKKNSYCEELNTRARRIPYRRKKHPRAAPPMPPPPASFWAFMALRAKGASTLKRLENGVPPGCMRCRQPTSSLSIVISKSP